jgi:protein arginine kinase activator
MKCDMCDQDASVFLTQILDGKMTQANLCEKCSKEKGVTDPTGFQLADFLLGNAAQKKVRPAPVDDDAVACPECGFTRAHLKKIGRMGCPECYQAFADDLDNMLRAMHKGTRHVGKVPGRQISLTPPSPRKAERPAAAIPPTPPPPPPPPPPVVLTTEKKVAELKAEIELAVEEERYEDAARLRDEMRALDEKG